MARAKADASGEAAEFEAVVLRDEGTSACGIQVPFDPRAVFGKVRAPVVATVGRHEFRTTIASMGGAFWIPLSRANREAAGVAAGERVRVRLAADDRPREVAAPDDLLAAIRAAGVGEAWERLSFSHRREWVESVESAKRPETRARRVERAVASLARG